MKRQISLSVHKAKRPDPETIDRMAGEALAFLAADPERLRRFFDLTGLSVATLREAARVPDFAASLFAYIAADERLLLGLAAEGGRDPAEFTAIRKSLGPLPGDD